MRNGKRNIFPPLAASSAQPAAADKRVALVIGNSAYERVPRLQNPVRDASAIADMFRAAKFDVVEFKRDLSNIEMRRELRDFSGEVRDADIAVIYYAGHGIEVEGINYLIPVDARLQRDTDAFDEAISLDRALQVVERASRLRLIILDACRDNPFSVSMQRSLASRALTRGLASVEQDRPNTLVAFAARAGSTADDGTGTHSPFTAALLDHLISPGLDIRLALGQARDDVMRATHDLQEPFVYGSLGGAAVPLVPAPVLSSQPQPDPRAVIRRDYEYALQANSRDAWEAFLRRYSEGFYAGLAKAQLGKIAAEEMRVAATERAKQAEADRARLAAEQATATAQANAAADAKAAEEARLAAEKLEVEQQISADAAERLRAAAEQAVDVKLARERAEADAKAILEQARAEVTVIREKAEADARAAEQARKAAEEEAERLRMAALQQASEVQSPSANAASISQDEKPSQLAALPPANATEPTRQHIARMLQIELRRVGCFSGNIDDDWSASAQRSLEQFNKYAGMRLAVASLDAIDAVKSKPTRICPLICDHGFKANDDTCERIVCRSGFVVGDENACVRSAARPAVRDRVRPAEPNPVAKVEASTQIICGNNNGSASTPCRPIKKGCHMEVGKIDNREVCP